MSIVHFVIITGLMTQTSKSTRRHAIEIINNLNLLRDACYHLNHSQMNAECFALFSSWHSRQLAPSNNREMAVVHPTSRGDNKVSSVFPGQSVQFYTTFIIGHIRFTTTYYAKKFIADDSSVVFRSGHRAHFGRIQNVFTVDGGEPLFRIAYLPDSRSSPFKCALSDNEDLQHFNIQSGSTSDFIHCIVSNEQIIEKCVYYEEANHFCTFFRFPSLMHSS
jgi:hypothetical protein